MSMNTIENRKRICLSCGYDGFGWKYQEQEMDGLYSTTAYFICPKCGEEKPVYLSIEYQENIIQEDDRI